MKFIKRSFILLLAVITLLSSVSCKKPDEESNEPTKNSDSTYKYEGTHVNNVTDTNIPFIVNGKTEYKLVLPATLDAALTDAKNDFLILFEKATGISLSTVKDTGLTHNADVKYLSIGDNELFKSTGLTIDKVELGLDGYQIFTKDKSIYMVGGSNDGSAYSIYSFFEHMFNYECYYSDCVIIDTGVTNLNLKNFEIKEIPDIALRNSMFFSEMLYPCANNPEGEYFKNRMKARYWKTEWQLPCHKEYDVTSDIEGSHSSFHVIPPEKHQIAHPKWFANNGQNLCYVARGDEAEMELLVQETVKKIIFSYVNYDPIKYPKYSVYHIGLQDNASICSCDACKQITDKYGAPAATTILYINKVADKFKAWEQGTNINELFSAEIIGEDASWMGQDPTPYIRPNFKIIFFAYAGYMDCPDEHPDLKLRDNVGVYWADLGMDWQQSILSEANNAERENFEAWSKLSDCLWTWRYGIYYNNKMFFYDAFDTINSNEYAYYACHGMDFSMVEGTGSSNQNSRETSWKSLLMYLNYKLAWNTSLDTNELIDNFFNAMFADGAKLMKQYFYDLRAHTAMMNEKNGLYKNTSVYNTIKRAEYWPKQTVYKWMELCDKALERVEKYKITNPKYYEQLRGHIAMEFVFPAYLNISFYEDQMKIDEKKAFYDGLREDAVKYDLVNLKDGSTTWGSVIGVN